MKRGIKIMHIVTRFVLWGSVLALCYFKSLWWELLLIFLWQWDENVRIALNKSETSTIEELLRRKI